MRTTSGVLLTRFAMEVATALVTMLIGAIACYGSVEFGTGWGDAGPEPGYFPFYVGLIVVIASAAVLIQSLVLFRDRQEAFLTTEQGKRILAFFGPMFLFVLVASMLGLYVSLTIYLFCVMVFQGGYRPIKAATVGVSTAVICYLLFEAWFQVPLLKGPVEAFLGIH